MSGTTFAARARHGRMRSLWLMFPPSCTSLRIAADAVAVSKVEQCQDVHHQGEEDRDEPAELTGLGLDRVGPRDRRESRPEKESLQHEEEQLVPDEDVHPDSAAAD